MARKRAAEERTNAQPCGVANGSGNSASTESGADGNESGNEDPANDTNASETDSSADDQEQVDEDQPGPEQPAPAQQKPRPGGGRSGSGTGNTAATAGAKLTRRGAVKTDGRLGCGQYLGGRRQWHSNVVSVSVRRTDAHDRAVRHPRDVELRVALPRSITWNACGSVQRSFGPVSRER